MPMVYGADAVRGMYLQLDGNAFFEVKRWWADEERQDLIAEMRVGRSAPTAAEPSGTTWSCSSSRGLIKTEIGYHSINLQGM